MLFANNLPFLQLNSYHIQSNNRYKFQVDKGDKEHKAFKEFKHF